MLEELLSHVMTQLESLLMYSYQHYISFSHTHKCPAFIFPLVVQENPHPKVASFFPLVDITAISYDHMPVDQSLLS